VSDTTGVELNCEARAMTNLFLNCDRI